MVSLNDDPVMKYVIEHHYELDIEKPEIYAYVHVADENAQFVEVANTFITNFINFYIGDDGDSLLELKKILQALNKSEDVPQDILDELKKQIGEMSWGVLLEEMLIYINYANGDNVPHNFEELAELLSIMGPDRPSDRNRFFKENFSRVLEAL